MTACVQIVSVLVAFALNKTQQELIRGYSDDDEEVRMLRCSSIHDKQVVKEHLCSYVCQCSFNILVLTP